MDIAYCIESKKFNPVLPTIFIGKKATEGHDWHYYLSRKALCGALETLEIIMPPESVEIEAHLHIKNHPDILVSLSHTKEHAIGLATRQEDGVCSVGVDLELRERKLTEGVEKFYYNDHDAIELQNDPLLLWSLKEAAFKALSPFAHNFQDKVLVLKDIWINEGQFGLVSYGNHNLGVVDYSMELRNDDLLLISFALLLCNSID